MRSWPYEYTNSRRGRNAVRSAARVTTLVIAYLAMSMPSAAASEKVFPVAPQEVFRSAPDRSHLVFFLSSGEDEGDNAVAVYERGPGDGDLVHRDMAVFDRKNGVFEMSFISPKLLACPKCGGFKGSPEYAGTFKVMRGEIKIEQLTDVVGPAVTYMHLRRRGGVWRVTKASRVWIANGVPPRGLLLPTSGLASDMDPKWKIAFRRHELVGNRKTGKWAFVRAAEEDGPPSNLLADLCRLGSCEVLAHQETGCIALVKSASGQLFAGKASGDDEGSLASTDALRACHSSGAVMCEEIKTDCWRSP